MKQLFTLLTLCVSMTLFAQNYQTIPSFGQQFFTQSTTSDLFGIEIQNVTFNGFDSVYHFVKTYENDMISGNCTDTTSWVGSKMTLSSNGNNIFYNIQNEAIIIKINAYLNDSWTIYNFSNGDYIEAMITSVTNENIVGSLMDSVKTITLQAKDNQGNNLTNNINGKTLKISKNYGFVQTLKLLEFPDAHSHNFTFMDNSNHIGNYKLTAEDVYDYQVGDVFQRVNSDGDYHYHVEYAYAHYEVLSRVDGATIRTYTYARSRYTDISDDTDFDQVMDLHYTVYYPNDTITEVIDLIAENNAMKIDRLPYELYGNGDFTRHFPHPNKFNNRLIHQTRDYQYTNSWDNCHSIYDDWGDEYDRYIDYGKGIGKARDNYFTLSNFMDANFNTTSLIYYQKGTETWGQLNTNLLITDSLASIQEGDYYLVRENLDKFVLNQTAKTWHSVETNNRNINNYISTYSCETTYEPLGDEYCKSEGGFIANKILVDADKNTLLINRNGDTIYIKTQANLNDTWTAMTLPNGNYIEAKVVSVSSKVWLSGFNDYLDDQNKRISFTAKDANGTTINHMINDKYVEIGQKNGFYEGIGFLHFPNDTSFYSFQGLEKGNGLLGENRTVPNEGYKLTNYQPGTEFHYKRTVVQNNSRIIYLTHQKITNVISFFNPLEYEMEICEATITEVDHDGDGFYEQSDSSAITSTTINLIPTSEVPNLQGTHFEKIGKRVYHFFETPTFAVNYRIDSLAFANNDCVSHSDSCWNKERYTVYTRWFGKRKDVRKNTNTCTGDIYSDIYELVYYNINGWEFGSPVLDCNTFISDNQSVIELSNIKIAPNPANDMLNIQSEEKPKEGQIRVFNNIGQTVFEQSFSHFPNSFNLQTANWENGLYFVEITIGNSRKVEKVVVQH